MASPTNPSSLEVYISPDELADELVFQKTLLLTLDSTAEGSKQVEAEIKATIADVEAQLRAVHGNRRIASTMGGRISEQGLGTSVLGETPHHQQLNNLEFASHFSNHNPASTDPFSSDLERYDEMSPTNQPSDSAAGGLEIHELQSRKRPFCELLELDNVREAGDKSKRTSPSPFYGTAASYATNCIDSFQSDPVTRELELYNNRQKKIEEAALKVKEDEEYARRLQDPYFVDTSSLSRSRPSTFTGRSAYDRMMGRQSHSQLSILQKKEPQITNSGTDKILSSARLFNPDPGAKGYDTVTTAPNSLVSAYTPTSSLPPSTMPGSYPSQDSDSSIEITSSADFQDKKQEYYILNAPNSIDVGFGSSLSRTHHGPIPATNPYETPNHGPFEAHSNRNGQSSLHMRHPPHSSTNGVPSDWPSTWSHKTDDDGSSSSFLHSTYDQTINGGYPGASTGFMNDPVAQILHQTSAINYGAMRDRLSQGLAGDIYNYVNDPRKTEKEIQNLLENIRPDTEIPVEDREGTPEGLKYPLYEHQKLALTWLKSMEDGSNKGGILADDMGLGKTISALALMLSRPSLNNARKTTLIVGPVALIRQWEREISSKIVTGYRLSTFVYHSGKKATWSTLRTYDVVLTTYGTLAAEYKKYIALNKRKEAHPGMDDSVYQSTLPFLGKKSKWYRVILDEAQCIKNKNTKAALATSLLEAETRFCLTGTPMMNGVHELYSLIHFLRIKPYNDHSKFSAEFSCLTKGTGPEYTMKRAMKKLQAVLKAILLRRTKQSQIDGKPILVLPEKTEAVSNAIFDEDEQAYYTSLEKKTRLQFNKYLKAGTVGKNYSNILVLLLRLRQAACHPHLIMDFEEAPTEATAEEMLTLAKSLLPGVIGRIVAATVPFECPVCYDPVPNPSIVVPCGHDTCAQCLVKITSNFDQAIANGEDSISAKCPTCRGAVDLKKIIDYETFRRAHMSGDAEDVDNGDCDSYDSDSDSGLDDTDIRDFIVRDDYESASETNVENVNLGSRLRVDTGVNSPDDYDANFSIEHKNGVKKDDHFKMGDDAQNRIEECDGSIKEATVNMPTPETGDDSDDEDLPEDPFVRIQRRSKHDGEKNQQSGRSMLPRSHSRPQKTPKKSHQSKKLTRKEKTSKGSEAKHTSLAELKKKASKSAEGRRRYMRYLKKNWVSSSKIDKCLEILRSTPPDVKTIIFSQFTTLLDLMEVPIHGENIGFGRYDGSMTADARNGAIVKFTDDPTCRILLVSLKAGNSGLNLVAASQVIILDPFWNPFIEMQAVDRAHRIGQQKPVKVHRILVEGTVEDRIIELQNRKRKFVDAALDENASRNVARLGREELIFLFGNDDGPQRATIARTHANPNIGIASHDDFGSSDQYIRSNTSVYPLVGKSNLS